VFASASECVWLVDTKSEMSKAFTHLGSTLKWKNPKADKTIVWHEHVLCVANRRRGREITFLKYFCEPLSSVKRAGLSNRLRAARDRKFIATFKQHATGACSEHTPHLPSISLRSTPIPFPIYSLVFGVDCFLPAFPPKPRTLFPPPHTCHMPCPSYSPFLHTHNDIWGWVRLMTPLTVQLLPFSSHDIPHRSK
jgi:hypothetical protein